MNGLKIVISGGGTGGHIFPAISIANAIRERYPQAEILFVGANDRMEMKRVPAAGYQIVGLQVAGFNRKTLWKNIPVLWKLLKSLCKARKVLKQFQPDVAIGVGGYASGPTLRMANSLNIPTVLMEQNSYAGMTNKLLAKKASKICVGYDGMERFFPAEKIVMAGTPCRQDLANQDLTKEEACTYFGLDHNRKTVLVVGGSLGSRTINHSVLAKLDEFTKAGVQLIWQCGEAYLFDVNVALNHRAHSEIVHAYDFISRMDLAYKAADLVISRAGAGSIAELSLLGKPTILVPSPNVAEDHQTKNAKAMVEKNAAIMVSDAEASKFLIEDALSLVNDDKGLEMLSINIAKLAYPNSANRIVDEVMKIIESK